MVVNLKVANVHFNSTGSNRIEVGSAGINIIPGANGMNISQYSFAPIVANSISFGTTSKEFANVYVGSNRLIYLSPNDNITHNAQGLSISSDATISFDAILEGPSGDQSICKAPTFQLFTSSGTWTKPTGCRWIKVSLIGGGGGSGGASFASSTQSAGGGGASGAICIKWLDVSSWSNSTTVTIGSGGTAGSSGGGDGGAGGTSSFGTHMTAPGGAGGNGMVATPSGSFSELGGVTKNIAIGGDYNGYQNPGHIGQVVADTNTQASGAGGIGLFGTSAQSFATSENNSSTGIYGGGAGGAATSSSASKAGAAGGDGVCLVEEFY